MVTPALAPAELTPVGAQRSGNDDGSIPSWTGGISLPPQSFVAGRAETDPFPEDEVLFQINAANAEQYRDRLTPGQLALLALYPDTWHLNVYQSRRSASFPDFVYEAIAANGESAQLVLEGNGGVLDTTVSSPFISR